MQEVSHKNSRLLGAGALVLHLLAFTGFGLFVFVSPAFLLLAIRDLPVLKRVLFCWLWGTVFAAFFYSWSLHYGVWAWLGLSVVRGTPWLAFCLPQMIVESHFKRGGFVAEAGATGGGLMLVSWLLLLGPTGADWETPIGALTNWPFVLSLLPWLGLTGAAFLIGAVSHLLVVTRAERRLSGFFLLGLWTGLSAVVFYRSGPKVPLTSPRIAVLQTGWGQTQKWDRENQKAAEKRLFQLTTTAAEKQAELIVWPETAWPNRGMRKRPRDSRAIGRLARELKVQLLVTSIEEVGEQWYNSVSRVAPTGRFEGEYRKRRLAPFAEFLPLPSRLASTLREMDPFARISRYLPGRESPIFDLGSRRYSVMICYETMTPFFGAKLASEIDFFVVVTNDAPFYYEWPKEAHFRSVILRAAEWRLPIYQAANTGVTGAVDSQGRVLQRTPPGFSGSDVQIHGTEHG